MPSIADPDKSLLYEQIREQLREFCRQKVGTALPPLRQLSRDLEVNHFTVSRALRDLENEGVVEVLPRKGVFVRKDPFDVSTANIELVTFYHNRPGILGISSSIIHGMELAGGTGMIHGTTLTVPPIPDVSRFLESLKERRVGAVLFLGVQYLKYPDSLDEALFIRTVAEHLPAVIIGCPHPIVDIDVVYGDPRPQLRQYLELCYKRGFRHFGCVGVSESRPSTRERFDTFKDFLLEHGIQWNSDDSLSHSEEPDLGQFFSRKKLPDVIIAMDIAHAIAALMESTRRGLKAGRDIHFLTFTSNEMLARTLLREITVIHTEESEVGRRAYQLAQQRVVSTKKDDTPATLRVETRFLNLLM